MLGETLAKDASRAELLQRGSGDAIRPLDLGPSATHLFARSAKRGLVLSKLPANTDEEFAIGCSHMGKIIGCRQDMVKACRHQ